MGERSFTISTPGIAKFDFYGRQFLRPYATFPHPNVLAAFMVLAILIINSIMSLRGRSKTTDVAIFLKSRFPRSLRSLGMTTGFLAGIVTLLTVSRVAIVAGLMASMILLRKKGRLLILLALLSLLPILYARFSSLLNFDNLTLIRREQLSENAYNLWLKSPIFGVGLNNFIPAASGSLLVGVSRFLQPAHNIILLALSETGILGLLGFLLLIGFPALSFLRKQESIKMNGSRIKSGMTICWLIIIFLGMFDHYFLTLPQGYRMFFLIWGLSFSSLGSKL